MKILHRSLIVSRIIFKNIDPVILIGLGIGLLGGLGLAIGGNLLSSHIMDSYRSFLQHSLIGMRGSLVLKTNTTQHLNRFEKAWTGLYQEYPSSPAWLSQGAQSIQFNQAQQTWKRQVRMILLEEKYLNQKMKFFNPNCTVAEGTNAFGNHLLFLTLNGLRHDLPFSVKANWIGSDPVSLRFSECELETGMMTDYPMLILSWDALGWNPKKRAMHYEFSTPSMETAVSLEAQLDQLMQTMHETYEIENLFQDPKMELAVSLSKQANWLIGAVGLISFVLSLIILFFGFLLLLEFKKQVVHILRLSGVARMEVSFGFVISGLVIGVFVAFFGSLIALSGRELIVMTNWIPFNSFFTSWNVEWFFWVLISMPFAIALFSGFIIFVHLPSRLSQSRIRT